MAFIIDGTTGIATVDGSVSAPSQRGQDSNSGISYAADTIKFSTNGVERFAISNTGLSGDGSGLTGIAAGVDCIWSARMSANQTISNSTETTLAFDREVIDTDNGFNTSTSQYTVPSGKGGKYLIYVRSGTSNMDEGKQLNVNIRINGYYDTDSSPFNNHGMYNRHESGGGAEQIGEQVSVIVLLAAGDVIDTRIWHNEGNPQSAFRYRGMFFGCRLKA